MNVLDESTLDEEVEAFAQRFFDNEILPGMSDLSTILELFLKKIRELEMEIEELKRVDDS